MEGRTYHRLPRAMIEAQRLANLWLEVWCVLPSPGGGYAVLKQGQARRIAERLKVEVLATLRPVITEART